MEWLKEKRKQLNLTQEEVAIAIGIKRASYTNIENGKRNVTPEIAKKIAKILNFEWTIFFETED